MLIEVAKRFRQRATETLCMIDLAFQAGKHVAMHPQAAGGFDPGAVYG